MPRPSALAHLTKRRRTAAVDPADPVRATAESYARNLFVSTALRRMERSTLNTLEDSDFAQAWARETRCRRCGHDGMQADHIRDHLREWLAANGTPCRVAPLGAVARRNLRLLGDLLGLDDDALAIVQLLVVHHRSGGLQIVTSALGDLSLSEAIQAAAAATRLPLARVAACLRPGARLLETGLVAITADCNRLVPKLHPHVQLLDLVFLPELDRETFLRAFLEPAPPPGIDAADFPDPASLALARALLGAAVREGAKGVNVLVHGPTGVGKTELARLLGQELGLQVLSVGRADENGDSATPHERLASLRLALQLAPRRRSLLLFDELEDLFRWELDLSTRSRAAAQMSKQWFAALLEENPIPIVWCTNRIDGVDPAFLRRFAYAVELRAPGALQRARVLARHLGEAAALPPADVDAIARRFEVSPAQLATAVRAARLVAPDGAPDRATIERLLAPVHKAISGEDATRRPVFDPSTYRVDALRCDEDLETLAGHVARFVPGAGPGLSFCLYGPPGTGKSELVRWLAWRAGRPLVYRRVSDLVSCWVGETERNIAAAFEEARQDGAVLLFDEADSFLRDRAGAARSWEVTQVNEFLQQLEAFPGIVACTTNLFGDLDAASLRRFVFKLELRYPTAEQSATLLRSFFPEAHDAAGRDAVVAALRRLPNLAPGDLAAVARRLRATGARPSLDDLVRLLAAEVAVKRDATRAVGFCGRP